MKKLIIFLRFTAIAFTFVSTFFLIYSISNLFQEHDWNINCIYNSLGQYSELYKFTFIICAFWVTLRQLEIAQSNYLNTQNQIRFIQEDILFRRNKEIAAETLKQCNIYLQELQIAYKELTETGITEGSLLNWVDLDIYTRERLKEKYPTAYNRFEKADRESKNKSIITLFKIEAFSSLFIYGNLDKNLAQTIIGVTFTKQVKLLFGLIAYFRQEANDNFAQSTIKLLKEFEAAPSLEKTLSYY